MAVVSKDINYTTKDGDVLACLASPKESGKLPGVVLIHEIFGLDNHIRDVAKRIAAEGYIVIAPHLFSSRRFSETLSSENISEAMRFMFSIPIDKQRDGEYRKEQLNRLDAKKREVVVGVNSILFENRPIDIFTDYLSSAVDYLHGLDNFNGKVGSVGFCFGGGMSINLGCTGKTDTCVIFYGENPNPIDKISGLKGSVMGLYGGEDTRINSHIDELVGALAKHKIPFTIRVFKGAYHAFFNDTRSQGYNREAAEAAWSMLINLFKSTL